MWRKKWQGGYDFHLRSVLFEFIDWFVVCKSILRALEFFFFLTSFWEFVDRFIVCKVFWIVGQFRIKILHTTLNFGKFEKRSVSHVLMMSTFGKIMYLPFSTFPLSFFTFISFPLLVNFSLYLSFTWLLPHSSSLPLSYFSDEGGEREMGEGEERELNF